MCRYHDSGDLEADHVFILRPLATHNASLVSAQMARNLRGIGQTETAGLQQRVQEQKGGGGMGGKRRGHVGHVKGQTCSADEVLLPLSAVEFLKMQSSFFLFVCFILYSYNNLEDL